VDNLKLLVDLHVAAERQGPGDVAETLRAIELSGLLERRGMRIADVGCGTGASTLVLAANLDAEVIAVDLLSDFLDVLRQRVAREGLGERLSAVNASMDSLPFKPHSLDAIWSEGAIYNIGFENGVRQWRQYIRPGGILAVSELTWLTANRPAELETHWCARYPEVGMASAKLSVLERNGFAPLGYFVLPEHCWLENYYRPLQQRFPAFLAQYKSSDAAALVAEEEVEISLYERYREFVSYGFYIARTTDSGP
jgi:SAM-dependent methyltransferase